MEIRKKSLPYSISLYRLYFCLLFVSGQCANDLGVCNTAKALYAHLRVHTGNDNIAQP